MIDYIQIGNLETTKDILLNGLLLEDWIEERKGNVLLCRKAKYHKIWFFRRKVKYGNCYFDSLKGSLHYFRNKGKNNHNDFNFSDIVEVVNDLILKFDIIPTSRINNIEFGINVVLPFECKEILENLITHKGESFTFEKDADKCFYQCKRPQFIIKIYDKGLQFGLPTNVLRFEIKVLKMQYLHNKGITIKTLNSLKNRAIYKPLGTLLIQVFNEILIDCENVNKDLIAKHDREKYYKATNPNTWSKIKRKTPAKQKELQRLRSWFDNFVRKSTKEWTNKELVSNLIKTKWNQLSEIYQVEINSSITPVHNLPLKYRVTFGLMAYFHFQRPSIYSSDF